MNFLLCTGIISGDACANSSDTLLMRKTVGSKCSVKASGGIKHPEEVILMIESGANRLGNSNGVKIINAKKLDV